MIVRCLPYISIMAVYLIIRAGVLPTLGSVPFHLEMLDDRLLTLPKTVWLYLRLLVLPMDLNAFYNVSFVKSPWTAQFILPSVALLLLLAGWKFCYTRQPHLFFGLGWIFVTLLPVLNVIPLSNTTTFFSERYLYIPCFGFCLAIGCLFKGLLELKGRPTRKRLFMTALCLLVVFEVYGFETVKRNLVWRNELTLWLDTARKSPDSFMVRTNLSLALYDRGRLNEAHREIREAIRLYPQHDTPYYILGVILYQKAEFHDSITALKEALRINPHQKDALNLMASIKKMLSDG